MWLVFILRMQYFSKYSLYDCKYFGQQAGQLLCSTFTGNSNEQTFRTRRVTLPEHSGLYCSGALSQGSNSKIEKWFLAAVALFEKVFYSHFWHVDVISHCADNGLVFLQKFFVSCQYTCANSIFELKTAKCSPNPKRP